MPTDRYDPKKVEARWQKHWLAKKVFKAKDFSKRPKKYILVEFPYPSGAGLHMGHLRPYVAADVYTRFQRARGHEVLFPIGWDAFGLPAENYAIKNGVHPSVSTAQNVKNAKAQMLSWGLSFDWDREINTTDPSYYRFTQRIFLELYRAGLAYEATGMINWCPKDKTGLANEEVIDGKCERCGTVVEKKELRQWYLKITDYADSLLEGLNELPEWPEQVKLQQANWIGKSEGLVERWQVQDMDLTLETFTTWPHTTWGATFMVVAPEHPVIDRLVGGTELESGAKKFAARCIEAKIKDPLNVAKEKEGFFTGRYAVNYLTGWKMPIYIANFAIYDYGTGLVKCTPAHDERDFEFAKKYQLPLVPVVAPMVEADNSDSAPKPGQPARSLDVAFCVIKHAKQDRYLVVKHHRSGVDGYLACSGSLEPGETPEQAGEREIREETGLKHFRFIRSLGEPVYFKYFKPSKNENRLLKLMPLYFEADSDELEPTTDYEKAKQEPVWLDGKDIEKFLRTRPFHRTFYRRMRGEEPLEPKMAAAYTGEGVMINAGKFIGMESGEARRAISEFSIAEGHARYVTNYRLRDWVFSRQRYWGEPIPLIHCDACASRPQKALLIHGFEGSPEANEFPYLKRELEAAGFTVVAPKLEDADHPTVESWTKQLVPLVQQLGPDDVVMGHSLGAKAAILALLKAKKKIKHLFLIAGTLGKLSKPQRAFFDREWPDSDNAALEKFWNAPASLNQASRLAGEVTAVLSEDDPFVLKETHEKLPRSWNVLFWQGYGHFDGEVYPELLKLILSAKNSGIVPVPEKDLPVRLPNVAKYEPTGTGESPLAGIDSWVNVRCPVCKGPGRRETNTMPQWAGSSWYWLRYADPKNTKAIADKRKLGYWQPVDVYFGGMEHTTLHLLYARFWNQFLFDRGLATCREPFEKRVPHGIVLGPDGEKMSKSRGNVVNPQDFVEKFGADATRMYEMFLGPHGETIAWNEQGILGVRRFLDRVWTWGNEVVSAPHAKQKTAVETEKVDRLLHKLTKKITEDLNAFRFNTCVSAFMEFHNEVKDEFISLAGLRRFLSLMHPFAPHLAEELASCAGVKRSLQLEPWPEFDPAKVADATVTVVVQVNGKVRGSMEVAATAPQDEVQAKAVALPSVKAHLGGGVIKRAVFVPGKLLNLVV